MLPPNEYVYTGILNTLTSFGLGLFVLVKQPKSLVHRCWFAMSVCVAVWAALFSVELLSSNSHIDVWISRVEQAFAVCIPVLYLHFVLALLHEPRSRHRVILNTAYGLTGLMVLVSPTPLFVKNVVPQPIFDFRFYEDPGLLYWIFLFLYVVCVVYAFALLARGIKRVGHPQRGQYLGVLAAGLAGFSMGATCFPLVYNIQLPPIGFHFVWLYSLFMTYAILKHHLMDINLVIRKSVVYSALVTVLTLAYFTVAFVSERYFQSAWGYQSLALSLVVFAGMALAFQPLKQWLQALVDRWWLPEPQAMARRLELLEQEVREADKAKAVGRLAAGVAHEIKNPLAALQTFMRYLPQRRDDTAFMAQFQQVVGQELGRLQQLAQGLVDFAKPGTPQRQPIDVTALLEQVLALTRAELAERRITVQTSYGHNGSSLIGNAGQLSQAVLNLILNARDAMAAGGTLTVTTRSTGRGIELAIADTGQGIAPADLPRLFEPFFTKKPHGTGLGLSIVQRIIQDHGGTIAVDSRLAHGTTFTVHLPASVSP